MRGLVEVSAARCAPSALQVLLLVGLLAYKSIECSCMDHQVNPFSGQPIFISQQADSGMSYGAAETNGTPSPYGNQEKTADYSPMPFYTDTSSQPQQQPNQLQPQQQQQQMTQPPVNQDSQMQQNLPPDQPQQQSFQQVPALQQQQQQQPQQPQQPQQIQQQQAQLHQPPKQHFQNFQPIVVGQPMQNQFSPQTQSTQQQPQLQQQQGQQQQVARQPQLVQNQAPQQQLSSVQVSAPTQQPMVAQQQQQQQQQPQQPQHVQPQPQPAPQQQQHQQYYENKGQANREASNYHYHHSPLFPGHNPYIETLKPLSYVDDNIVILNLSYSHIYEIHTDAFVGQRLEHIDLSNNKLGLIHSRSFRIGPSHSSHEVLNAGKNISGATGGQSASRRPPPGHPKSVTIDFSHNPAILALPGAFDHIDVPNCLLNFTNSTVELKFGAFKKYLKEHPGHIIDVDAVDCCEQDWLLGYRHNFVARTHCDHDPNLIMNNVSMQAIMDSCVEYLTRMRRNSKIQGPSLLQHQYHNKGHSGHQSESQFFTYLILGGTAVILTSLSIYIIIYMFTLKAAFVYQMQNKT